MAKRTVFDFLEEEPIVEEEKSPEEPKEQAVFAEEEQIPEEKPVEEPKKQEPFPFEGENDLEREIERSQARTTSRIAETILGAPGDISNFITSLFGLPKSPIGYLSSDVLKKGSEKLSLGYTSPQTDFEKAADEAAETFASMALPGSWGYGFARNLGIPIASTLAKEGIKSKFGDEAGTYAGLGTMLFLDLLGGRVSQGGAKQYANNLFRERDKLIPEGARTPAKNVVKKLDNLAKELNKGGTSTSTKPALTKIKEIKGKVAKDGSIAVEELPEFQKKINEAILEGGGFEIQAPKAIKQRTVDNLNKVKSEVIDALSEYGKESNPEFLKLHQQANRARAVYEKSNVLTNFIRKHFGNKITSPAVKALFGLGGAVGAGTGAFLSPAITGLAGTVISGGAGVYQALKLGYRVAKSPELRKHYAEVIKHALAGNVSRTEKSLKALEKSLKEDQEALEERLVE